MIWMLFGVASALVLVLALFTREHVTKKLAMILFTLWGLTHFLDVTMGYHRAPYAFVVLDTISGLYVAWLVLKEKSLAAAMIFALFLSMGAEHVAAFSLAEQGTLRYVLVLNALYTLQLIVVGGTAVVQLGRTALSANRIRSAGLSRSASG